MAPSVEWPDYLVLVPFLVASLGIGVYHAFSGGRQRTTTEFIMANRSLGVVPTAISMLVSFLSAVTLLSGTAEIYVCGAQHLLGTDISYGLAVIIAGLFFVPWIYPLRLISVYQYLEMRYDSKGLRMFGASLGILYGLIMIGITMFAPSIALETATGLPITISIPVMAVVTVGYTALGGMRAVIWTDVFQFVVMLSGMIAVLIRAIILVGGVNKVTDLNEQEGRLVWATWSPDPTVRTTFWGYVIGWTFQFSCQFGITQSAVQRYSATENLTKARLSLLLTLPALIILLTVTCGTGMAVFAYYALIMCDPLASKQIKTTNEILPHFVTTAFSHAPGFTGLFLATLYGGALSSVSSYLSGVSAVLWEDVLKWTALRHLPEERKALINRFLVVIFGVLGTGVAFLSSVLPGTILQVALQLAGLISGPLSGMLLLGGLTRYANWKGALFGCIIGLAFTLTLNIGSISLSIKHPPLPPISTDGCQPRDNYTTGWGDFSTEFGNSAYFSTTSNYTDYGLTTPAPRASVPGYERFFAISHMWYQPFGMLVTLTFGFVASLICRNREAEKKVKEIYLFPCVRSLLGCMRRNQVTAQDNTTIKNGHVNGDSKEIKNDTAKLRQDHQDTTTL